MTLAAERLEDEHEDHEDHQEAATGARPRVRSRTSSWFFVIFV
jgi:hypothetical protein